MVRSLRRPGASQAQAVVEGPKGEAWTEILPFAPGQVRLSLRSRTPLDLRPTAPSFSEREERVLPDALLSRERSTVAGVLRPSPVGGPPSPEPVDGSPPPGPD